MYYSFYLIIRFLLYIATAVLGLMFLAKCGENRAVRWLTAAACAALIIWNGYVADKISALLASAFSILGTLLLIALIIAIPIIILFKWVRGY